jgi:hypothetical protein
LIGLLSAFQVIQVLSDVKEAFDAAVLPLCSRGKRQGMSRKKGLESNKASNQLPKLHFCCLCDCALLILMFQVCMSSLFQEDRNLTWAEIQERSSLAARARRSMPNHAEAFLYMPHRITSQES